MPRNPEGEGLRAAVCAAVRRHRMFSPGERVIVALSGGPDSVALLHVLLASEGELGARLSACHLNHRLRGEEAGRDEAFVRGDYDRARELFERVALAPDFADFLTLPAYAMID